MFSTAFQKYKENPIPPSIKLSKHKKTSPQAYFFPTFAPKTEQHGKRNTNRS